MVHMQLFRSQQESSAGEGNQQVFDENEESLLICDRGELHELDLAKDLSVKKTICKKTICGGLSSFFYSPEYNKLWTKNENHRTTKIYKIDKDLVEHSLVSEIEVGALFGPFLDYDRENLLF